jgi:hypothetical protein
MFALRVRARTGGAPSGYTMSMGIFVRVMFSTINFAFTCVAAVPAAMLAAPGRQNAPEHDRAQNQCGLRDSGAER